MNRGPAFLLTAEDTGALELTGRAAAEGAVPSAPGAVRRGSVRRLLEGFRDSCALVAVALLGCLALVAIGTVGSLVWMFLGNL
jgi:nitrate reductase NapE component